jgi:ferredoxin
MARTDANPPMPEWSDEYQLVEVDADYLAKAVKPKQFIHIDQSECIMCEGCVDICPWKCIHMVTPDAIAEPIRLTMCCSSSTMTCVRAVRCVSIVVRPG